MGETRTGRDRRILCGTAERHRPGTVLRLLRGERLAYGTEPYAQLESGSAYLGTKKGRQFRRKHAGTSADDKACRPGNTVLGLCVLYLQSLLSCGNGCGKWRRVPTVGNDSSVRLTAASSSKRITPQSPTVTAQHKAHPTGALKGSLYMPPLHRGGARQGGGVIPGNVPTGEQCSPLQNGFAHSFGCLENDSSVSLTAVSSSKRITPQSPTVTAQHKAHPTGALKGSLYCLLS